MATLEEAVRCPKCEQPGEITKEQIIREPFAAPKKQLLVYCRQELCRWFNTAWTITVREDGTIPDAFSGIREKQFPTVSPESETRIKEAIAKQVEAETRPGGGEVTSRGGGF
jgi:hypothetical protein